MKFDIHTEESKEMFINELIKRGFTEHIWEKHLRYKRTFINKCFNLIFDDENIRIFFRNELIFLGVEISSEQLDELFK